MTIELKGRIDSQNAAETEKGIRAKLAPGDGGIVLDAEKLEYISSAGLRVLLRLRKEHPDLSIINVSSEVYEILEMTGFTEMMTVEKAYRRVSIEGCELIGRGAKGSIYRIDRDNVVKVYKDANALEDIRHERETARLALILGIPTAISYDVVRVGDSYGSVFELLNASSFSRILASEPEKLAWCASEYASLLKKLHSTVVPSGKLPDMKERMLDLVRSAAGCLPPEKGSKLISLVSAVPRDDHMIHGDYHTGNLELMNDEVILIDMDTLAVGAPIFELGLIYSAFVGFSEVDPGVIKGFLGIDRELGVRFWRLALENYLGTKSPEKLAETEDRAGVIGYARLLRHSLRHGTSETRKEEFEHWKSRLSELLERVDSLVPAP